MAFFDDLGKKISQAGQTAVQKTKDMTDIAKINSAISDEEKNINNVYRQIGKIYVAKYSSDCAPELAGMVKSVKEAEARVAAYRKQILDIKGVMCCEKCGAEIASNVAFCSFCGAPAPKIVTPDAPTPEMNTVRCPGCGQAVAPGMKFCTTCGQPIGNTSVNSPVAQPTPPVYMPTATVAEPVQMPTQPMYQPEPEPTAPPVQPPVITEPVQPSYQPAENRCPNCGNIVGEELFFCTSCGTKLK